MRRAGSEARRLGVGVVARQHMVIDAAEDEAEIDGGDRRADLELADMDEVDRRRIGDEAAIEGAEVGPREEVGHAHALEGLRLLLHQHRRASPPVRPASRR